MPKGRRREKKKNKKPKANRAAGTMNYNQENTGSQFPKRWEPIKGSYLREDYSRRGSFNGRDFASVAATTAAMQPFILGMEAYAMAMQPQVYGAGPEAFTASFVGGWLLKTLAVSALKTGSCFLRNYGDSLLRDVATWLWINAMRASWYTFRDMFLQWIPFFRNKDPQPGPWNPFPPTPHPQPQPPAQPSWFRQLIDRWRQRRNS